MDTHKVIRTLTDKHNLNTKQAEGIVYAIREAQNLSIQGLATKEDLANFKLEMKDEFRNQFRWILTFFVALSGLMIALSNIL